MRCFWRFLNICVVIRTNHHVSLLVKSLKQKKIIKIMLIFCLNFLKNRKKYDKKFRVFWENSNAERSPGKVAKIQILYFFICNHIRIFIEIHFLCLSLIQKTRKNDFCGDSVFDFKIKTR